jgi:hypothetical protein
VLAHFHLLLRLSLLAALPPPAHRCGRVATACWLVVLALAGIGLFAAGTAFDFMHPMMDGIA